MARGKKKNTNSTALTDPETRKEIFMAKAAGLIESAPSVPYTREERYWLAIIEAINQGGFSPTEAQLAAMDSGITENVLNDILNGLSVRPAPLNYNMFLYVSPEGNDNNDGLTQLTPKRTIGAAVNLIPKNVGTKVASIQLMAGTYADEDNIRIADFEGVGRISISPYDNTQPVIINRPFVISNCVCQVQLSNLTFGTWGQLRVLYSTRFSGENLNTQSVGGDINSYTVDILDSSVKLKNMYFKSGITDTCLSVRGHSLVNAIITELPPSANCYLRAADNCLLLASSSLSSLNSKVQTLTGGVVFINGSIYTPV